MPFSDADTVVALLEAGARIDVTCAGAGVLWWAIQGFGHKGGSAAAVRALLAAGADANEVTDTATPPRRVAPLALAFEQLSTKYATDASGILKALVAGGADRAKAGLEQALTPDGSVRTALSIAYRASEQPQHVLLRVLLAGWTRKEGVLKAVAQLVARLNAASATGAGEPRVTVVARPDAWLDARFDHTLRVSAVPPALLRDALARLVDDLRDDSPVTGIELKGALAPDGSADSLVVQEEGARSHMPEHVRSRYA